MATKKAGPTAAPVARKTPDFTDVPGELVPINGLNLVFGKGGRKSPYDALLDELAQAQGKVLNFGDPRARTSVIARAKKKGYRVSLAECEGALYVRFDGSVDHDLKQTRRDKIREILTRTPGLAAPAIAARLRETGDTTADGAGVVVILEQMLRTGEVLKQEGGTWIKGRARAVA